MWRNYIEKDYKSPQNLWYLKRLFTKALGHKFCVFHLFIMDELFDKIQALIPIREHGVNWGIRHVKVSFTQLDITTPRWKIFLNTWIDIKDIAWKVTLCIVPSMETLQRHHHDSSLAYRLWVFLFPNEEWFYYHYALKCSNAKHFKWVPSKYFFQVAKFPLLL